MPEPRQDVLRAQEIRFAMPKKHALLIANTEYRDGKLSAMAHPGLAYAELAEALKDPARGAFAHVETLVNANLSHVLNTLDRFFSRKPADDVLLVYVGAHGFVDSQGELFLALKESDRFRLKSTALMAAVLGMNMDQCPSPHKLLILDCRFHSPYQDSRGAQAAVRCDPSRIFAGRGLPKRILSAGPRPEAAAAAPPASSTQKLQAIPKDFTRVLAETFRTPSNAPGGRTAFTVMDWWNDAIAELKASKAEPPILHAVGEPPVTFLRGSSLPRQELALSQAAPGREPTGTLPSLPAEPGEMEAEWSRLSGIFPLEMFAPDFAPDVAPAAGDADAADGADAAVPALRPAPAQGGDGAGDGSADFDRDPAGDSGPADRTLLMMRGDQTIIADPARFVEGSDLVLRARQGIESSRPMDLSDPDSGTLESPLATSPTLEVPLPEAEGSTAVTPAAAPPDAGLPNPRDTFTDLRARLRSQEEQERQARLAAEREEADQREKLNRWKARWDARHREKDGEAPKPEAEPPRRDGKPKSYRDRVAALQKTLYVPPPDAGPDAETRVQPPPPAATSLTGLTDGTATVMVSRDQFLNTGIHKTPTLLTPGATIHVSRDEFLGNRLSAQAPSPAAALAAAPEALAKASPTRDAADAKAADRTTPASEDTVFGVKPSDGDRDGDGTLIVRSEVSGHGRGGDRNRAPSTPRRPGTGRRTALWVLAGLVPVGLSLFLYFGTKAGLFWSLGLGPDPAAKRAERAEQARRAAVEPTSENVSPAEEEGIILPAESASMPSAESASGQPTAQPAPASAEPVSPATAPAAPAPAADRPAATRPAIPAAAANPNPAGPATRPAPAARPDAQARAAREAERLARAQYVKDSLKAYRVFRDSLLTVRAQAKQDSIQQARLLREQERSRRAEAEASRVAAARAQRDSLRAHKDSVRAEALLRKSVNQAVKAGSPEMRTLYNRFALGYPGLQGEVVLELLVDPTGEIEKGSIRSSSTGLKMFDQLVLGNVLEWRVRPFKARESKAILLTLNFPMAP